MGNRCVCREDEDDEENRNTIFADQERMQTQKSARDFDLILSARYKKYNGSNNDISFEENQNEILHTEKSLKKPKINTGTQYEEDFKQTIDKDHPFQTSLRMSSEIIKNKRMIFNILYTNTKISKKLFINPNEIFITYDTIESLNDNEVVYDCKIDKFYSDWKNEVYIKIYKTYIILLDMNRSNDNKETILISEITEIQNLFKKDRREANYLSGFKLVINDKKEYEFKSKNAEIGKSSYEIIKFLKWKIIYDKKMYNKYNKKSCW